MKKKIWLTIAALALLAALIVSLFLLRGSDDAAPGFTTDGTDDRSNAKYSSEIKTAPTVAQTAYVGQSLADILLAGGSGNVPGVFSWTDPAQKVSANGSYSVTFTPYDADYGLSQTTVSFDAVQLTVTVTAGENGSADPAGTVNVDYGSELTVTFSSNTGYGVDALLVNGQMVAAVSRYTFTDIREDQSISATFAQRDMSLNIVCIEGTPNCYTIAGNTVTFTQLGTDSVYAISGDLQGNIVIAVGDEYKLDLELSGFNLWSDTECPLVISSGNEVTITAKNGTDNFIYDLRQEISADDESQYSASVYSMVDLELRGKGSLTVKSDHNNGIHSKKDMDVKNLSLSVTCADNALKGNDGVIIQSGTLMLIAAKGDGIKTTNSDISTKGNQRGSVTISGGSVTIHAACDGIDAAYDVVVDNSDAKVQIYTDKYSSYSEEVTQTSTSARYIRYTSKSYNYSVKYYNSDTDFVWVNATYAKSVSGGRSTYYYYSIPVVTGYDKVQFFIYTTDQTQGQDTDYAACSDYMIWNTAYDTFALSARNNQLSYSWTNYSASASGGMGGSGGMDAGNTDKSSYSAKGIKAANAIHISAGTISVKAYDDAIHANRDSTLENGKTPTGSVTISGGTLTLYSNDDGIHADGALTVTGGDVSVTGSYEGLEGTTVTLDGGNVSVVSSDDGVNATAASGQAIIINSGTLYIYAGGDGLDSNSRTSYQGIVFNGGNTVVISTSSGNSAIDTEQGYAYNGGYVLALMPSGGMSSEAVHCSNFSSIGTRNSGISLNAGAYLTVSVDSSAVLTVKVPSRMSGMAVFLGGSNASFSTDTSTSKTLDANGVWWLKKSQVM